MNKTHNLFKLSSIALLALGLFTFSSCGGDDDDDNVINTQNDFAEQYFNVEGSTYHNEAMPSSTINQSISGISISSEGETATISIDTDVEYDCFYVGVEGTPGYLEYPVGGSRASKYNYKIRLTFGSEVPDKVKMQVKGKTKDGGVTQAYSQSVEPFGGDIGTNNIAKVRGDWRYTYEQDDDMGTVNLDYTFMGGVTSSKLADFKLEDYETEDAWRVQVEGQYKLTGSTLRLYFRRVRDMNYSGNWTEWVTKGSSRIMGMYRINWQDFYNTWTDYVEQGEGAEVWECIVNDARTEMQWRRLQPVYNYDYISGETSVSYKYYENEPIRHLKKL